MKKLTSLSLIAALALSASAFGVSAAHADGASRVTWKPSYAGSCEDCSLVGRQMLYSDLSSARYSRADLSHASLFGSVADSAEFGGVTGRYADFSQTNLNNAQLSAATLTNARFVGAQANGANFSGAQLDFSAFSEAMLIGANLTDVSATHMNAAGADFSAANATGANFDYANLRQAIFDGAQLQGASFAQCDLTGARFRDARLAAANLSNAKNVEKADFTGACRSADTQLPNGLVLRPCNN
ncbi:MAG: pentapeptide repeat-containing protein [Hyphomonadaceae bacterium]